MTNEDPLESEEFKKFKGQLTEEFLKYDHDKNGTISLDEFRFAMKQLNISDENQSYIFGKIDKDKSNTITLNEYYDYGVKRYLKLKSVFTEFDSNKDGKISLEEFHKILEKNKISVENNTSKRLFDKFDENKDGFIDFFEWKKLLFFIPHIKDIESIFYKRSLQLVIMMKFRLKD